MAEETKKLECPFTWNINGKFIDDFDESELSDSEEINFLNLMNSVMKTFVFTVKCNYNEAKTNLKDTEAMWITTDKTKMQLEEISIDVACHVIYATKYYVLKELNNYIEVKNLFNDILIPDCNNFENLKDCSTLYGCISIAWSIFHESAMEKAISFASLAVQANPNCSLWHFILGKNLRRHRRTLTLRSPPSKEELESFLKSYNILKNPLYGIYLAQAYQENLDYYQSDKLQLEIYNNVDKTNYKIQLRLVLCFLRKNQLEKAKICLDNVKNINPECCMLFHYQGMYYLKSNNYESAAKYFKKAANYGNFGADLQYGKSMAKVDADFSYLYHLLLMQKKYECNKVNQQHILLHIAMEFFNDRHSEKCLKYFTRAIKLLPKSKTLKEFHFAHGEPLYNIFEFIDIQVLPFFKSNSIAMSLEGHAYLRELQDVLSDEE